MSIQSFSKNLFNRFKRMFFGTKSAKEQIAINSASIREQFPVNVKLDDGRHRYYKKFNILVDRLN